MPGPLKDRVGDALARTEAQRSLEMLDCDIGLACPIPECAAKGRPTSVVRVERQGTIDQRHHRADVLAERGQRMGGIHQDDRIVAGRLQRPPSEIGAFQTVRLPILTPTVGKQPKTAVRGAGERRTVTRIARDRLLHETQRLRALPCRRQGHCRAAQIEVVGGQIGGRTAGRSSDLGRLQRRLDDPGELTRRRCT